MVAGNLYTKSIVPLRTSDTGREALSIMNEFHISHLPIVNNKQLLGLISEDDIINNNIDEAVGSYQLSQHKYYVTSQDHIYEVMRLLGEFQLSVIPVIDLEGNYLGLIFQDELLEFFSNTASFSEPGAIVVLEMNRRDYSLSEISRIVESENAAVLSAFVTTNLETGIIDVTLKINRQEVQNIIATFERFSYKVKASFQESLYNDTLKERYDMLMSYLNI